MHICNKYLRNDEKINLIAHSNKCLHNFQIDCKCNIIEQVVKYKYVGILIDQNFEWDLYIITVINKFRSAMYQLRTLKTIVNENTLRTIYFSAVHPYIYIVWNYVIWLY
jgi:hypothetical protein